VPLGPKGNRKKGVLESQAVRDETLGRIAPFFKLRSTAAEGTVNVSLSRLDGHSLLTTARWELVL